MTVHVTVSVTVCVTFCVSLAELSESPALTFLDAEIDVLEQFLEVGQMVLRAVLGGPVQRVTHSLRSNKITHHDSCNIRCGAAAGEKFH